MQSPATGAEARSFGVIIFFGLFEREREREKRCLGEFKEEREKKEVRN